MDVRDQGRPRATAPSLHLRPESEGSVVTCPIIKRQRSMLRPLLAKRQPASVQKNLKRWFPPQPERGRFIAVDYPMGVLAEVRNSGYFISHESGGSGFSPPILAPMRPGGAPSRQRHDCRQRQQGQSQRPHNQDDDQSNDPTHHEQAEVEQRPNSAEDLARLLIVLGSALQKRVRFNFVAHQLLQTGSSSGCYLHAMRFRCQQNRLTPSPDAGSTPVAAAPP
jgi:hypothetical protein